jgi:hypothetical protein
MSEQVTSFKAWWADGGRIGGGLWGSYGKPAHLFPYTSAERRPGIRWWAIALFVVAVAGLGWYVNTLFGVLGGAGRQAVDHAGEGKFPGLERAISANPTPMTPGGSVLGGEPLAAADLSYVVERVNVRRRAELERAEEVVVVNDQVIDETLAPEVEVLPFLLSEPEIVIVRLQSYWPDDGPDWCLVWDDEENRCVLPTTAGDDWRAGDGALLACPAVWLGCQLRIVSAGLELPCSDTGVSFECHGRECAVGLVSSVNGVSGLHSGTLRCPVGVG